MEPRYDAHAAWYEAYLYGDAYEHTGRTAAALSTALGCGSGLALTLAAGPASTQRPYVRTGGEL